MVNTPTEVASLLAGLLLGDTGLNEAAGALQLEGVFTPPDSKAVVLLQAAPELVEKTGNVKYPVLHVYCERLQNTLKEKFRRFSGTADLSIEIRVSHDHLDGLQSQMRDCLQVVTAVLEQNRGAWSSNTWYSGAYEVIFSPVRRGGRNYLQTARVRLELAVQAD